MNEIEIQAAATHREGPWKASGGTARGGLSGYPLRPDRGGG